MILKTRYQFLIITFYIVNTGQLVPSGRHRQKDNKANELVNKNTILSLHSSCRTPNDVSNLSPSDSSAVNRLDAVHVKSRLFQDAANFFYGRPGRKLLTYVNYDVCDSMDDVSTKLLDLFLGDSIRRNSSSRIITKLGVAENQILIVIVSLSRHQANLVASLFSFTDVIIAGIDIDTTSEEPPSLSYHTEFYSLSFEYDRSDGKFIADILNTFNWQYVYLITLSNKRRAAIYSDHKKRLVQKFKREGICFDSVTILKKKFFDAVISNLASQNKTLAILLLGDTKLQLEFIKRTESVVQGPIQWLTHGLGQQTPFIDVSISDLVNQDASVTNFILKLLKPTNLTIEFGITETWIHVMFDYLISLESDYNELVVKTKSTYVRYKRRVRNYGQSQFVTFAKSKHSNKQLLLTKQGIGYDQINKLIEISTMVRSTTCLKTPCIAGHENVRVSTRSLTSLWAYSLKWRCNRCTSNYYKDFKGIGDCQSCPAPTVSNQNRTGCFDPYSDVYISLDLDLMVFALWVCGVGMAVNVLMLGVFIKYRNTPIARSCDLRLTWLHFGIVFALHALFPFLYIGRPTRMQCIARPISVSSLYVINLAIVLIKSEKLVNAFSSNIKIDRQRVKRTQHFQLFIVVVLVSLSNLILFLTVYGNRIDATLIVDVEKYTRTYGCNSTLHFNMLIAYSAILQLACLVQAFRGRKLPDSYKDCVSYVYGSFITTIVTVTFVPIFLFQGDEISKQTLQMSSVALNNFVLLMSCYAYKVYVMVFQPYINNPEFLRNEYLEKLKHKKVSSKDSSYNDMQTQC